MARTIGFLILLLYPFISIARFNLQGFAGVNFSTIAAEDRSMILTAKYNFSAGINPVFRINDLMSFQPGISIERKGGKMDMQPGITGSSYFISNDVILTYINIPLTLNIYPFARYTGRVKFFLQPGVYGGFNIWTNMKTRHTEDFYSSVTGPDMRAPFDSGLTLGVGFDYSRLSIIIRGSLGLSDVMGYPGEKYYNRSTGLFIGYRFLQKK
jgi:hypothetical protein